MFALSDDRWWVPLAILGFIPLVVIHGLTLRAAGLENVPSHIRPISTEAEEARCVQAKFDAYVVGLQSQVDAAGDVPNDIPLTARIDCLIKQRDGLAPRKGRWDVD